MFYRFFHDFPWFFMDFTTFWAISQIVTPLWGQTSDFQKIRSHRKKTKCFWNFFWDKFMYKTYRENCLPVPGTSLTMLEVALYFFVTYFSGGALPPTRRAWCLLIFFISIGILICFLFIWDWSVRTSLRCFLAVFF